MRKILAAATFGLVLSVAGASNPADQTPEARAYLGFSFGGERAVPRDFHYGLRLDHDSRFVRGPVAPLMQLDFTRSGFGAARINGVNVVKQQYRLHQAEEPSAEEPAEEPAEAPADAGAEAASAEEPGFFSKMWGGVTGLFGGDEEEGAVEETAAAEPAEEATAEGATGEEVTEGMFLGYNVVDWGLLAAGAVGLGFAVGEVSNSSESLDPNAPAAPGPSTPAAGAAAAAAGATPIGIPLVGSPELNEEFRERLQWLDGGTGHMGDLQPQAD